MRPYDVLILGSGFGGSLLSQILVGGGFTVALIDRARHPRFAIGESSTPLADATLARLADRYHLSALRPLTQYGSWKRTYPGLLCGRKRGFTYFRQLPGRDLTPADFEQRRLLAAASVDDEHSDTQWLRSDVDQFFFQQAAEQGVSCLQECEYRLEPQAGGWRLQGTAVGQGVDLRAGFVVDATGASGGVLRQLGIPFQNDRLKTNSRAVYAHFAGVTTCEQLLHESGIRTTDFPFCCDDAAVHQVLDDGWMWQLRFDDDTLSAGFVIDQRLEATPAVRPEAASAEWDARLARYPFLQRQFASARVVRPAAGLQVSGRLQRLTTQAAGSAWAVLPHVAGFVDALHSMGIAHTLSGVERLAAILLGRSNEVLREQQLREYSGQLIEEVCLIDELVEGCYAALPHFSLWCDWTMLYLAAVTSMERDPGERFGNGDRPVGYLRVGDREFRAMLREARRRLTVAAESRGPDVAGECQRFRDWLREALKPWNQVGLLDPQCDGLYGGTAAPPW